MMILLLINSMNSELRPVGQNAFEKEKIAFFFCKKKCWFSYPHSHISGKNSLFSSGLLGRFSGHPIRRSWWVFVALFFPDHQIHLSPMRHHPVLFVPRNFHKRIYRNLRKDLPGDSWKISDFWLLLCNLRWGTSAPWSFPQPVFGSVCSPMFLDALTNYSHFAIFGKNLSNFLETNFNLSTKFKTCNFSYNLPPSSSFFSNS